MTDSLEPEHCTVVFVFVCVCVCVCLRDGEREGERTVFVAAY